MSEDESHKFREEEAQEEEEEGEYGEADEFDSSKKSRLSKKHNDPLSDEEEEELGDEPDGYVPDGFVVDDGELEEENEKEQKKKKRKRKKREEEELDAEDLILLEDAGVFTNREPTKSFKRIKKKSTEEETGMMEGEGEDDLLGHEEPLGEESFGEEEDDFYENYFEVDNQGRALRASEHNFARNSQIVEAAKIFGDEDLMEEEFEEETRKMATIEETYEPDELARLYLKKEDQEIQKKDLPERLQLREKKIPIYMKHVHFLAPNKDTTLLINLEKRDGTKSETTVTIRTLTELKERFEVGEDTLTVYVDSVKVFYPLQNDEDLLYIKDGSLLKIVDTEEGETNLKQFNEKKLDKQLRDEAEWIFHHVFEGENLPFHITVPKIIYILKFLKRDGYEIPYIYLYKKDYYIPDLKLSDLWEIYDWDEKWEHLQYRKATLYERYLSASVSLELFNLLEESHKDLEVQDLYDHFFTHYGEVFDQSKGRKRAQKRDLYSICKRNGILKFSRQFGLSASEFGENMDQGKMIHFPQNYELEPSEMTDDYVLKTEFKDSESVIKAAKSAMAQEISLDPRVRSSIRPIYETKIAGISTYPTPKGKKEIEAFHPYRVILRIDRKPPQSFQQIQFLLILKAKKEGFIDLKVEIAEQHHKENIKEMENLYLDPNRNDDPIIHIWNNHRREILTEVLEKYLYPQFEKELIQTLSEQAKERVAVSASEKFTELLMLGPYRPPPSVMYDNPTEMIIMSCCSGVGREPTHFVVLDPDGMPKDNLQILGFGEREEKVVSDFIMKHSPNVIAVGATLEGRKLYDFLRGIKTKNGPEELHVTYVDIEVARIFEGSPRARAEFADYSSPLRLTIGLARYLKDPLIELAAVCSAGESLYLKLHNLQDMVTKEHLSNSLYRCAINVVNSVGVDINQVLLFKHVAPLLEFVSGLGPRKSIDLIRRITRRGGSVSSRDELEQFLEPCVFTNAVGFLRILRKYAIHEWTPLDDTRIHPDDYLLVEKMAKDALETNKKKIIRLMQEPKKLDDVDLDEFAEELKRKGKLKKKSILYDIKAEINHPFQDRRNEYKDPTREQLFTYFTGEEEDESIRLGQLVNARVVAVFSDHIRCELDSGLPGIIEARDISDYKQDDLSDMGITPGDTIACRIKKIEKDNLRVLLICKSSELQNRRYDERQLDLLKQIEPYLLLEDSTQESRIPKRRATRKVIGRQIDHPLFSNSSFRQAEEHLKNQSIDDVVIRPSSKGTDHLTITWKFYDDIFVHINIREENKANPQSLGKSLYIDNEKYEDLDEILARHIDPMIRLVQDMIQFRRYFNCSQNEAEDKLRVEKQAEPSRIPYIVTISHDHPGKFVLSYLPNQTCKHEYISICPQGFRFRERVFPNPEKLVSWFKTHWKDSRSSQSRHQSSRHVHSNPPVIRPPPVIQNNTSWSTSSSGWV